MSTKKFDYGLAKVCQTLKLMRGKGWKPFLDERKRLRLHSPNGHCFCPETALVAFSRNPKTPKMLNGSYMEIEFNLSFALNQDPTIALCIAASSDCENETIPRTYCRQSCRPIYPSKTLRKRLLRACGLA